ncbi:MAG TPA: UDP-glucose/GDP-mannose dehydrogenase family protein [Terriglobales bacterium]|nr:UDP-glucose/GDP-mannose dehydrogenase family protein [Terriglobales bacterium]
MSRSVSVFGLGYVGAVTAACLAERGHRIVGVDPNPIKVDALNAARTPIVEARMNELIEAGCKKGLISATRDANEAIQKTEISFVSVGTPSMRNGKLELGHIEAVCRDIGQALAKKSTFHTIVIRSTVLPGTTQQVVIPLLEKTSGKKFGKDFAVCFNPEFLREGSAVADFFEPPMTVIGCEDLNVIGPVKELYEWAPAPLFETTTATAEMVKYVCNAFHALKVAFANEIGTMCREMTIDPHTVMDIFKTDTRLNISKTYLSPGFAFGGSCLPKDLRALNYKAKELDTKLPLLESIMPSNDHHIDRAVEAVLRLEKRTVGMLGLSFKSGTDDLRESPNVVLAKRLLGEGCQLKIWDDHVRLGQLIGSNRQFIEDVIPHIGSLLCEDMNKVVEESEIIVVGTNAVDRKALRAKLRPSQTIVDLVRWELPRAAKREMAAAH